MLTEGMTWPRDSRQPPPWGSRNSVSTQRFQWVLGLAWRTVQRKTAAFWSKLAAAILSSPQHTPSLLMVSLKASSHSQPSVALKASTSPLPQRAQKDCLTTESN